MEKTKLCCMLFLCYGLLQIYLVEGENCSEIFESHLYYEITRKSYSTMRKPSRSYPNGTSGRYECGSVKTTPVIEDHNNGHITVGGQLKLTCSIQTYDTISVQWGLPNGEAVYYYNTTKEEKNQSTLFIDDITFADAGIYTCYVVSPEEFASNTSIYVNIFARPVIKDNNDGHTTVGGLLNLTCSIQSDVLVSFQWRGPHLHDYRIHDEINQSTLIMYNTVLADTGTYTCYVGFPQKHVSDASTHVNIFDVNDHILIMDRQYSIRAYAGQESVTWAVHVWGHPDLNYKWRNNRNVTIESDVSKYNLKFGNNASILTINAVDVTDFGQYSLTGWNKYENKTLHFFLNGTGKPRVTIETERDNQKRFRTLGISAKVNCTATAYTPPSFKWIYRSCRSINCPVRELQGTLIEKLDMVFVSQVEINATTEPFGILTCSAVNLDGSSNEIIEYIVSDFKDRLVMTEFDESVVFDESGKKATFIIGSPIRVACAASRYEYDYNIEWLLNDLPLVKNDKYKISRKRTDFSHISYLEKENANYEDAGKYSCKAWLLRNSIDRKKPYDEQNKMFLLTYPTAPRITGSEKEEIIEINNALEAELFCEVYGFPKPKITWYKGGSQFVPDGSRIQLKNDNQLLKFNQTLEQNEVTYECRALNNQGRDCKIWHLEFKNGGESPLWFAVVIVVLCIICAISIHIAYVRMRREKRLQKELNLLGLANFEQGAVENINPDLGLYDQVQLLPYDKKWEFPIENLKLGKQLGSGAFGVVMMGEAKHIVEGEPVTTVAVKMVKKSADHIHIKALASELKIMVHLGQHLNVVNLLGACTKNVMKKELLVIVEYCRHGNLQNYLLRHRLNFVNQVDPQNGKLNYNLGQDNSDRTHPVSNKRCNTQSSHLKNAAHILSDVSSRPMMPLPSSIEHNNRANQNSEESAKTDMTPMTESSDIVLSNNSIRTWGRSNSEDDYGDNVKPINTKDLVAWSFQVARGMEYLSSRKVLHGDLAARNILLADENVIKICDFGLAKTMFKSNNYKKRNKCHSPMKWMAIESIRDSIFSTQSDVWSFGIVLWELFSLARTPYPGMEADEKLYHKLLGGYRMESPEYAPKEIYELMTDCWKSQPLRRPSFSESVERLGNLLEDSLSGYYVDLNNPYLALNSKLMEDGKNDYLAMVSPPTFEAPSSYHQVQDISNDGYISLSSPRVIEGEEFNFNIPNRKPILSAGQDMLHLAGESETKTPLASPNLSADNYVNMTKNKDISKKYLRVNEKKKKKEVEERNHVNDNVGIASRCET